MTLTRTAGPGRSTRGGVNTKPALTALCERFPDSGVTFRCATSP